MDCLRTALLMVVCLTGGALAAYGSSNNQASTGSPVMTTTTNTAALPTDPTISILNNVLLRVQRITTAFYNQAVANYTAADFKAAGLAQRDYDQFVGVRDNENAIQDILIGLIQGLGVDPIIPCIYSYPITDIASLLRVSSVIQNTDLSAYVFAIRDIPSADIRLTLNGVIATKGQQSGYFSYLIGKAAAPGQVVPPLAAYQVASSLGDFIVSCSFDAPKLLPTLTLSPSSGPAGSVVILTTSVDTTNLLCAIDSGNLGTLFSPIQKNSSGAPTCAIPAGVKGLLYVILVRDRSVANVGTDVSTSVAGPAPFALNSLGDAR